MMLQLTAKDAPAEYRWANAEEIAAAKADGGHIITACPCGHVGAWMHKGLALSSNGGYTGGRNIFYLSWDVAPECSCPGSGLRMVVPVK